MSKDKTNYKITKKLNKQCIYAIVKIHEEKGLTPETLLEEAKKRENPLHDLFEWNNDKAAEQWRLQQARVLINEIKIKVGNSIMYAYENVNVKINGTSEKQYKLITEIMDDKQYREQVIKDALQHLSYWRSKYEKFKEFSIITKAIAKVEQKLNKKLSKKI